MRASPISIKRRRVLKRPMEPLRRSGENWALLARLIADCNHEVKLLAYEVVQRLRAMSRDVDTQFPHHLDGLRTDLGRLRAGRKHLESFASFVSYQPFGDLTPSRIPGADDQDALLTHIACSTA